VRVWDYDQERVNRAVEVFFQLSFKYKCKDQQHGQLEYDFYPYHKMEVLEVFVDELA
jgi:hypothetical protein